MDERGSFDGVGGMAVKLPTPPRSTTDEAPLAWTWLRVGAGVAQSSRLTVPALLPNNGRVTSVLNTSTAKLDWYVLVDNHERAVIIHTLFHSLDVWLF
jgi:hypothetical protein